MAVSQSISNENELLLNEIKILKEQNSILKSLNATTTTQHKEFMIKYKGICTEHKIAQNKLKETLTQKYESQKKETVQFQNKLESKESEYTELEQKYQALLSKMDDIETKNTTLRNKCTKQERDNKELQQNYNDTTIELKSQLTDYKQAFNQQNMIINDLQQRLEIATHCKKSSGLKYEKSSDSIRSTPSTHLFAESTRTIIIQSSTDIAFLAQSGSSGTFFDL